MDYDFWKKKYQSSWKESSRKEERIIQIIEKNCSCVCVKVGLGAGSQSFLSGSASSRGFKKGGSDLLIRGSNIFVEVTGPNTEKISVTQDLWLRPDKIQYAIDDPFKDCWLAHVLKKDFVVRVIHFNNRFKNDYQNNVFRLIYPFFGDSTETMVSIPSTSYHVQGFDVLLNVIKNRVK